MSTSDEPIDNFDPDSSPPQSGPMPGQEDISLLGLDGSLSSIRSVSLILQALIPLIISLILLLAGRRLYRFTTTVSVGLTFAIFTWSVCVNLENGQTIGGWTGEVAAMTVWSVMIGAGLIGAIIGYQYTWWGAHVTGRLCLGANSGVAFAFSILVFKSGLLIHHPAGQWSLVAASAIMGVLAVLCDHVIGPLLSVSLCGSFLFLLGVDLFNTQGNGGVGAGLRLLLDHNPDHQVIMNPYTPMKSTTTLIIVSWVIAVLSFGFQYVFYKMPFGPLPPAGEEDEEEGLGTESKGKESFSQGSSDDAKKDISRSDMGAHGTEQHHHTINISNPRTSTTASTGTTKTSVTHVDPHRVPGQHESSNLPYVSPRAGPVVSGEYGSAPALALSPTVYSRYRRTLDAEHKPPGRSPIQYSLNPNVNNFTNPRRVETVDEVTEAPTSVRGGDLTARSSLLTVGVASEKIGRSNSVSEEYMQAMMRLASGEGPDQKAKASEEQGTPGTGTIPAIGQKDLPPKADAALQDVQSSRLSPITESHLTAGHSSPEVGHSDLSSELRTSAAISSPNSVPTSGPISSPSKIDVTEVSERANRSESSSDAQDQLNIELNKIPRPLSKWPSCSSFGQILASASRESEDPEKDGEAPRAARARCPGISSAECPPYESNSARSLDLGAESQSGSCSVYSRYQGRNAQPVSSEQSSHTFDSHSRGSHELDASAMRRFSHRPLPLLPRGSERVNGMASPSPTGIQIRDTSSFKSTDSNGSSALGSFARVARESTVPTTPSWSANFLTDDRKEEVTLHGESSKKKLSIIVTKNPVQVDRAPMSSPTSQEAERDNCSDSAQNKAIPHTPTLGNMLLRVSEHAEKASHQPDNNPSVAPPTNHGYDVSREDDLEDGDGDTVGSETSKRSTVCMSTISAGHHTSADEGGQSSSGSEFDDEDKSQELYFQPGRFQQLDEAMSATREGTSKQDTSEPTSSTNKPWNPAIPFVGQPLAEVPWPQKRFTFQIPQPSGQEKEKRWTTTSSIYPPLVYESSAESPQPRRAYEGTGKEREIESSSSSESGTDRMAIRNEESIGTGTKRAMYRSASSHVDHQDEEDCHLDLDSNDSYLVGTDLDDPYESAADYSRSIRAPNHLTTSTNSAPVVGEGGYITADDDQSSQFHS
ncbi:hypothetical protein PSTG_06342 [Puccinia striiformis f. sp. tritici PST-78]|uniref:TM7S3/TM198-like domain-containing protein n=1 Tax=Puccinia striiformis f. sp. tritici PST-78 TaxID=1165861 RepID=A0A0L0VMA7_9BASI|nr:hypothetical protein PSTG_06342 [Puccinia striiformis f. sp. tritici PST-78]